MHRNSFLILDHLVSAVEQRGGVARASGYVIDANRLPVRAGTWTDLVG